MPSSISVKSGVLFYTGGLDSTVLLYWLHNQGVRLRALSVNHDQNSKKELMCSAKNTSRLAVYYSVCGIDAHNIVNNHCMVALSIAIGHAVANEMEAVFFAGHRDDEEVPGFAKDFLTGKRLAALNVSQHEVKLMTPFSSAGKADIVTLGAELGVPFDDTWSCEKYGTTHCGICNGCATRHAAFELAEVDDPTKYM